MSIQDLLIRHGEKVVVVGVFAACGWFGYDACTSDDIRYRIKSGEDPVDADSINRSIKEIATKRPTLTAPQFKKPKDYAAQLGDRLASKIPFKPFMAYMSTHPDWVVVLPNTEGKFYVYELLPPAVNVKDGFGVLEVGFELPESKRTPSKTDFLADNPEVSWSYPANSKPNSPLIENTVKRTGLQVEWRLGDQAAWQPLKMPGQTAPGLLPMERCGDTVTIPSVQAGEKYRYRARLLIKATGFDIDALDSAANKTLAGVLVSKDRFVPVGQPFTEWEALKNSVLSKDHSVREKLNPGLAIAIAGSRERSYLSDWSQEILVQPRSPTRLALKGLAFPFKDPKAPPDAEAPPPTATILLDKRLRDKAGVKQVWLKTIQLFPVKPGDAIGKEVPLEDQFAPNAPLPNPKAGPKGPPPNLHLVDLTTPYVFEKAEREVRRLVYYALTEESRAPGGNPKDKQLKLKPVVLPKTDLVILRNSKKLEESLTLYKLAVIPKPTKADTPIWPEYRFNTPNGYDEVRAFEKDQDGFLQWQLEVEGAQKPVEHKPGTGPLEDVRKRGNENAQTDVPYIEFPDGRLFWWEHRANHRRFTGYVPGKEPKGAKVAPPPPVEDPPAPEAGVVGPEAPAPAALPPVAPIPPKPVGGQAPAVPAIPSATPTTDPARRGYNGHNK